MVVTTILRYPGGKVKAIKYIKPIIDSIPHTEYKEPFVGGGSVFMSKDPVKENWINDIDKDLIALYKILANKKQREELIKDLLGLKISRQLYDDLYYSKPKDLYGKAKRFYTINRTSFSGITKWNAFIGDVRYNIKNAQDYMRKMGERLSTYKITSWDFEKMITAKSKESSFIFLDPPYSESRQIAAYNHAFTQEDHVRLAKILKKTKQPFLLTYDNTEFIRNLYDWAYQKPFSWTYSIANSRVHHNPREAGNELFVANFEIKKQDQMKLLN
jgi:DNA adenine methylase